MCSVSGAQYSVLTRVQKPTTTSLLILSVISKFTTLGLHSDISLEANLGTSKFCAVLSGSLSSISSRACHQIPSQLSSWEGAQARSKCMSLKPSWHLRGNT
ncbi:uncharacterized protein ARMOST_15993 [Armillaria ostoyae]|uniref:Uncharacterized protein n=1 Tax=Armillaria ostoyae TaxID=47428 RepID=A0A284RV32_ARMOS|nr:uncharacterized protein ARMOST_15993 [Armillaria ostoyae]